MPYDFDEIVDRGGTHAVKLEALPKGCPPDAIPVWVADMDFACAPEIVKALHERLDRRIFGYTTCDNDEYRNAVTGWFKRRYDWEVNPDHLAFCPGVVPAIAFALEALTDPGDKVVIQRPVYYPFTGKIEETGRIVVNNALLYQDGTYRMNLEELDRQLADPQVKGMILCSPHNPVGRVWTEQELKDLVKTVKKHDKWIFADEIHMDLTRLNVSHTPLLKVDPGYAHRIISATAPSKTFNLAGMQVSNLVIPNDELRAAFKRVTGRYSIWAPNMLGMTACIAAYTQGEAWLDAARAYIDRNIELVKSELAKRLPQARVVPTEGTYLVWIDLRAYESDPQALEQLMQQKARVAFDEGYIFGKEGAGFERLNVACPRSVVQDVIDRMALALVPV